MEKEYKYDMLFYGQNYGNLNQAFCSFDNSIHRIGKVGNQKRVVGVLLGSWHKKVLDVSNSFAGE